MSDVKPWRKTQPKEIWPVYERFRVFLRATWAFLDLPPPTVRQLAMADYLQYGPKRSIIEAFRGVGKSWITAAYVCWLLLRDIQQNIMVVSASKERADQFSTFTLRLIAEMPILKHLYPEPHQRQSKIAFDVAGAKPDQAPSVKSVGVFGQLTGGRADEIIADDVEIPNNSETPGMREKLAERVKEFDAVLKPHGKVKYLGTPQTEESLYNALGQRGYETRIWPARYPTPAQVAGYGDKIAPDILLDMQNGLAKAGEPTDAGRFNALDLMERELSYGRSGFALQFMLDTRLSDADKHPLKLSDLIVADLDREVGWEKVMWAKDERYVVKDVPLVGFDGDRYYAPMDFIRDEAGNPKRRKYDVIVMAVDPAGRGKDEAAYAVVGVLNGFLYLLDAGGWRDGYTETTLQALANKAKEFRVMGLPIEPNFGDGMFGALLKPYLTRTYPVSMEEMRAVGQKETRIIQTLEPVMNQHRLIVDRALIERDYASVKDLPPEEGKNYRLFYQMSRITKERGALAHDDRLDALAMAVQYLTEHMALDADEKAKEHTQEAIDADLQNFMNDALGHNGGPPITQWFTI